MDCNSPSIKTNKARIFISYSHHGNGPKWKATLVNALQVFERHHLLDVWEDGKIRVSSFFDDDIKQAMSNAQLAVVLLTRESLKSEYIINKEFPFLRERQQRDKLPVFPVICEPCDWKAHDWLRAIQAPNESNPLSQLSEVAQCRVFRKLATDIAEELSHAALAELPKTDQPPSTDHVYLDKFPLTRGGGQPEKLIGREQELALLDLAFAQPQTAIVSLVAWGGVGKTKLVQHWLQRLQREDWFGARRVYAWSFYSQGTKEDRQGSEDTFLAHALAWFGVQCEPTLSPWDKGKILADAVARERTLLILDGIEPLQYPPGPMGGQLRAPGIQSLLKQLVRKANADQSSIRNPQSKIGGCLCLVTTREPLTDFTDFERRPDSAWGSMLRVDLGNLTEEAGASLLHYAGAKKAGAAEIKADDAELIAASREVDGHALTLNLLGRFLARAHGGDIRRRDLVKFEEADRKEQGGTTFKMLAAFEHWFNRGSGCYQQSLAILRMLGLFDRPADAGCIGALRKPPVIAGLTDPLFTTRLDPSTGQTSLQPILEEEWNTATSFLSDFGLITIQTNADKTENLLDCHPLIREYFARKMHNRMAAAWFCAHRRLFEFLTTAVEYQPGTFEGLQPLYQAIYHGCLAGSHQEVCEEVYINRILRGTGMSGFYSIGNLGSFSSDLAALGCFFACPWHKPVAGFKQEYRSWLLGVTGRFLRAVGRLVEARQPMLLALESVRQQNNWKEASIAAGNLSELDMILGDLCNALVHAEQSLEHADACRNEAEQLFSRAVLADALHQAGRFEEASICFEKAESLQAILQPYYPHLYSGQGFEFCDLLLRGTECVSWCIFCLTIPPLPVGESQDDTNSRHLEACCEIERRSEEALRVVLNGSRNPLDIALNRLSLSRVALYRVILSGSGKEIAQDNILTAVAAFRSAGQQQHIPRGLLTRSWLRVLKGDAAGARDDLDEAWDIAERGPMRLHMADIHLYRARLFFRENPYPWKSP